MILPYYYIERTNEGKQFFFKNVGYFNFWNEYLIMHVPTYHHIFTVLVNRTGRKFNSIEEPEDYKVSRNLIFNSSVQTRKPEEMFDDFPELDEYVENRLEQLNEYIGGKCGL